MGVKTLPPINCGECNYYHTVVTAVLTQSLTLSSDLLTPRSMHAEVQL